MNKDLDALECIVVDLTPIAKEHNKEEIEQVKKSLEVLEIIKKKRVDVRYLFQCKSLRDYNFIYKGTNESELCLTQEEYKLLKDVLK